MTKLADTVNFDSSSILQSLSFFNIGHQLNKFIRFKIKEFCYYFFYLHSSRASTFHLLTAIEQRTFLEILTSVLPFYSKGKMLVNEYSATGTCRLEQGMRGKLTVAAVNLTETVAIPTVPLTFRVALQDQETGTIWIMTPASVTEIEIDNLLKQCKKGDKLIILTEQKAYSLTHNTIEIFDGC